MSPRPDESLENIPGWVAITGIETLADVCSPNDTRLSNVRWGAGGDEWSLFAPHSNQLRRSYNRNKYLNVRERPAPSEPQLMPRFC